MKLRHNGNVHRDDARIDAEEYQRRARLSEAALVKAEQERDDAYMQGHKQGFEDGAEYAEREVEGLREALFGLATDEVDEAPCFCTNNLSLLSGMGHQPPCLKARAALSADTQREP